MHSIHKLARGLVRGDEGVTALEYALIASLVAVAIITATAALGTSIAATFTGIAASL